VRNEDQSSNIFLKHSVKKLLYKKLYKKIKHLFNFTIYICARKNCIVACGLV